MCWVHPSYRYLSARDTLLVHPPAGGLMILLMLLLLTSCSSPPSPAARQATITWPEVPTATPAPTTSMTPGVGPTPVALLLAPAPTDCPITAPPQTTMMYSGGIELVGASPAWIRRAYYPTILHLNQQGYTAWPGTKILWEIGPNYTQAVTVQVSNLQTGTLAWWGQGGDRPPGAGHTLILAPNHPNGSAPSNDHGILPGGWHEWGTYVYLLEAGCYAIQVSWPSGHWRGVFAAGR